MTSQSEIEDKSKMNQTKLQREQLYDTFYSHENLQSNLTENGEDFLQKRLKEEQDSCHTATSLHSTHVFSTTLPLIEALTNAIRRNNLIKLTESFTQNPANVFKKYGGPKQLKYTVQCLVILMLITTQAMAANSTSESGENSTAVPMSYLPTPGSLVRLQRSAETASHLRTTQQKRDLPLFLSDHNKVQRLVTKYNYFVEIKPNGKVKGTYSPGIYSLMKFSSISTGFVAIQGNATGRYLAMDNKGKLVGLQTYVESACNFYEVVVENNYYVYYQKRTFMKRKKTIERIYYVGFDNKGRPRPGKKVRKNSKTAHFLKRPAKRIFTAPTNPRRVSPRRKKYRRPGRTRTGKPRTGRPRSGRPRTGGRGRSKTRTRPRKGPRTGRRRRIRPTGRQRTLVKTTTNIPT